MPWKYDGKTTEYIDDLGAKYDDTDKFFWLWAFLDNIAEEMRDVSGRYSDGAISIEVWRASMQELIEDANIAGYILGLGGIGQMEAGDYSGLDGLVVDQLVYLDKFEKDAPNMTKAGIVNRAGMYASSAQQSFWLALEKAKKKAGLTQERVVLGNAEHCQTCIAWSDDGWQPLGTFPPLGAGYSECLMHCRCHKEYR